MRSVLPLALLVAVAGAADIHPSKRNAATFKHALKPAVASSGCGACQAGGNTYRALPGCRSFTEESAVVAPRKLDCPAGLIFDTTLCVCNYENAVTCASDCGSVPPPPIIPSNVVRPAVGIVDCPPIVPKTDHIDIVTIGCGSCKAGGNIYRTIAGSGCMAFTEEAPGIAPRRNICPDGLVFDTNLCVCNWREAVQCSASCDVQPPVPVVVTATTPRPTPPVATLPPARPSVDLFVPSSGCGACQARGNTYRALPGCHSFTEESNVVAPRKLDCPAGLIFDSTLCVCNYEYAVKCASDCGAVPKPPVIPSIALRPPTGIVDRPPVVPKDDGSSKVTIGCGSCQAGGNTYRTVAGSGCAAFTEEAPGIAARRYTCPDGLVFDTNLCVCNWREAVQCSAACQDRPAPTTTTARPQVDTQPPHRPVVDLFIPSSGCGACQAGGNTYRALPGCRSFTEESNVVAPRKLDCPAGLIFDSTLCVCNYEHAVKCASDCGSVVQPPVIPADVVRPPTSITNCPPIVPTDGGPSKVTIGCGACQAGGNTYRTLLGSDCIAFTEEAPGIAPRRYVCPDGLVFDTNLCVCNWREAVQCSASCGAQPPAPLTTTPRPTPQVSTQAPGRPSVDLFIPSSGCRACQAGGNTYRALPGCRSFTEESNVVAPRKLDCPAGLVFDTTLCVCNYEHAVKCASDCGAVVQPPTIPQDVVRPPTGIVARPPIVPTDDGSNKVVIIGCGACQAGGNTYRTVAGSGCMAFTEEAPGIAARRYVCPAGLVFDTNLCVCNWREAVQCSASCGGQPPAINTTPLPAVAATQTPGHPPVDKFIPSSGCGSCQAGGNTYRALPGCRSFTEESAVVAPRKLDCPAGLIFDTTLCVCNYENAVTCASDCGSVPPPPIIPPNVVRPAVGIVDCPPIVPKTDHKDIVVIGCGECRAGGNTYRTLTGSGCMAFTEEAPGIAARRYVCPDGLVFDTNLCVCNWREAVQCSASCGVQPPAAIATTPRPTPPVATLPPARPSVDLFVPSSGCGVCQAGGNTYRALPGCHSFTEESNVVPPRKLDCPAGLVFDTTLCVCNYEYAVKCASDCGAVPKPPTIAQDIVRPPIGIVACPPIVPGDDISNIVTIGCGSCQAGGNTYRTVASSGCMAFTEEAPGIPARRYVCPEGLVFDTNLCVCNWREAVQCSASCGGQPPAAVATIPRPTPPVATLPPARPSVDHFIPSSGCGACQAGGNTYRALAGCHSFTEESAVTAPRKLDCPAGLVFDTTLCVCNYDYAVNCAADCGSVPKPPTITPAVVRPPTEIVVRPPVIPKDDGSSKVVIGCGTCQAGGSIYRTVAGSDCIAFTEEAPGIAARRYVCPDGLVFDTNLCVCNWREAVQCSASCGAQPPATKTELATPKPPMPVVQVNTGCGSCKTGCTVFRPLADGGSCNAFMEETEGAPSSVRRQCPPGLAFDVELCTCNWKATTKCTCGVHQSHPAFTPPAKVDIMPRPNEHSVWAPAKIDNLKTIPSGCGTCQAGGIIFRTVPGTGCAAFTKETAFLSATRFECNSGLVFDVSICQCNRKEAVSCSCVGDGKP